MSIPLSLVSRCGGVSLGWMQGVQCAQFLVPVAKAARPTSTHKSKVKYGSQIKVNYFNVEVFTLNWHCV